MQQSPDSLLGQLDHRSALFGNFPVGSTVSGNLYYTRRTLCGDETPGTPAAIQQQGYFLLVDRGGCSFVEKVRNAQKDNATAVLIADNTCLCTFPEDVCSADQVCEDGEPTMDDDGTGDDIRIPSMLLLKPDADKIKNELVSGQMIQLELSWPVPQAENGVTEYTLWMTPDDVVSNHFLLTFLDAATSLGDKAVFHPRMYIHDGTERGCRVYGDSDPCMGYCTNYGRYCEPSSYYDLETYDHKGTLMMVENLRRACIWDSYGKADGIGAVWWTYIQLWIQRCGTSQYSTSCAESLYETSGIDHQTIEECMEESGDFRNDVSNTFFDQYIDEALDYDVSFSPSLFVNGAIIRGALTFGTVLEAICMTYVEGDIPDICYRWETCAASCDEGETCILHGNMCVEYEVPDFSYVEDTWDDDYILHAETKSPTSAPQPAPTEAPIPVPTATPTESPVEASTPAPVVSPTKSPTASPTLPPVPPPTERPGPDLGDPVLLAPTSPTGGIVETIQIFEGNSGVTSSDGTSSSSGSMGGSTSGGTGGGDKTSFAAGLGAGIGAAVVVGILAVLFVQSRRRGRDDDYYEDDAEYGRRRRVSRKSYLVSPNEMSIEGSFHADEFEDETDITGGSNSRGRVFQPRRYFDQRRVRQAGSNHNSRRSIRRSRRGTLDGRRGRPSFPSDEGSKGRISNAASHCRRLDMNPEEGVSVPYVDDVDSEDEY